MRLAISWSVYRITGRPVCKIIGRGGGIWNSSLSLEPNTCIWYLALLTHCEHCNTVGTSPTLAFSQKTSQKRATKGVRSSKRQSKRLDDSAADRSVRGRGGSMLSRDSIFRSQSMLLQGEVNAMRVFNRKYVQCANTSLALSLSLSVCDSFSGPYGEQQARSGRRHSPPSFRRENRCSVNTYVNNGDRTAAVCIQGASYKSSISLTSIKTKSVSGVGTS